MRGETSTLGWDREEQNKSIRTRMRGETSKLGW